MGRKVILIVSSITFLSLYGVFGQETNTDAGGYNTVVGENGLIAVLPADTPDLNPNVDSNYVNPENGLIAVVPGYQYPENEEPEITQAINGTYSETNELIGVVPSTEPDVEPSSEYIIGTVSVTEENTNSEEQQNTQALTQKIEAETTSEVVTETFVEDTVNSVDVEAIGIVNDSATVDQLDVIQTNIEMPADNSVEIAKPLQKVMIAVSEKVEDALPTATFEVNTQQIVEDVVDDAELTYEAIVLIPTNIESVGLTADYGYSQTAEFSFIGDLIGAALPVDVEIPEVEIDEEVAAVVETRVETKVETIVETEEVEESETASETESEDADNADLLSAFAKGTQYMGKLTLNNAITEVLATDLGTAVYHTYQIDVPEGQEVLTIMVDGQDSDVDFAVKAGSEITSYNEVDYIDNSGSSIASYTYQFPPTGSIFIDVMNYTDDAIAYELSVSDSYDDAFSSNYDGSAESTSGEILALSNRSNNSAATALRNTEPLGTGQFLDLKLNEVLSREITAKKPSATMVYHSYELALPKGLEDAVVVLDGQGHDVDMALRFDKPIVRLDEVDFLDVSSDELTRYEFQTVEDTILYIDVMNYLQEAAHYELQVVTDEVVGESVGDSDRARAYAPSLTTASEPNVNEDITTLKAGQPYQGMIANYLKAGQEKSAMAESQSFLIRIPENTKRFVVMLNSDEDLDVALKYASPIESYALKKQGGDWDYLDMRPTTDSRIQVDEPIAGYWYVDVIQATYGQGAAPYTLQIFYP